jgi:hypothetical protein
MHIRLINNIPQLYSPAQLINDYPNTSFPREMSNALLARFDIYPVTPTDKPEYNEDTQIAEETTPIKLNGVWTQQWIVRDLTAEELDARVPKRIEVLQGLLAIDQAGLSGVYESWINSPERTFAEKAFINKARTWRRDDPILQAAATEIGLTKEQLDQLFILASKF